MKVGNKMNNNTKNIILFSFFITLTILLLIIYYAYSNKYLNDFNYLKINKSKKLIYTEKKIQAGYYMQYIPYININNNLGKTINNEIDNYTSTFQKNNIGITYEYNLNGNILSLIIIIEDHSYAQSATILNFKSYNINLKKLELVANETLLNYFNITNNDVKNILSKKLYDYYLDEVNANKINSNNCDYDCFLSNRDLNNNLDNTEYYIKNGKLIVYKPYSIISSSKEENTIHYFEIA